MKCTSLSTTINLKRNLPGAAHLVSTVAMILLMIAFTSSKVMAEGSTQFKPDTTKTSSIMILNQATTYGTFAGYSATDTNRLFIHINNPATEKIYFGIGQRSTNTNWYFRVKDPSGNIIYGPTLLPTTAGTGYIQYYKQANAGPSVVNAQGYNGFAITPSAGVSGDYYIEFNEGSGTTVATNTEIDFGIFDVTVVNISNNTAIPGRLFSYNWSFNTSSYSNQFYGSFYIYGSDSSVTKVDLNGMKPYKFRVSCNSWGCSKTGNASNDRKSRLGFAVPPELKLFLRDPDLTAYPSGQMTIINGPITLSRCSKDSVNININLTKKSDVTILIDLNGNGVYDAGTSDRKLFFPATPQGSNYLLWNGKDGLGNYVPVGNTLSAIVKLETGEVDLPMFDIENHETGFTMSVIRPGVGLFVDSLYFDDALVGGSSNFVGCAFPCHTWASNPVNTETNSIGNNNTMNTWWFAHNQNVVSNLVMPDYLVTIAGADQSKCVIGSNLDTVQLAGSIAYSLTAYNGSKQWKTTGSGTFSPSDSLNNSKYIPSAADITTGSVTFYYAPRNGCLSPVDTVVVTLKKTPQLSAATGNVNCFGQATGSVNLTVANSTSPYTYNWSNSSTSQNLSNVGAGTYTVTVTSANGCSAVASSTITQPSTTLSNTISSSTNVSCYAGNNGAINLATSGGTAPYGYQWNSGATTQNLSGLSSGTYTVTVTDSKGCSVVTSSITITQPVATLSASASSITNVSCYGVNSGAINLNVTGGTSPYTYSWNNGATSQNLAGIASGNYTATVTDSKGCTFITSAMNVSQPPAALNSSVSSSSNVSCFGGNNGGISLIVNGGTTPYSYNWSNGATTQNLTNTIAGTYSVTVTDAKGCTTVNSGLQITQPAAALSSSANSTANVSCFGGSNGGINLTVNGGTTPYIYSWSNGSTSQNLSSAGAGTYGVTVTDSKGCSTANSGLQITQPTAALNSNASSTTNVSCFGGNNGGINLTVNGGTTPYSYNWSNGSTSQNLGSVVAGTYSVTVMDSKGCTISNSGLSITQPAGALNSNAGAITNVSCFGGTNGGINLTVNGGTTPYTYTWSNGSTSQNLGSVTAGTYSVTVTDAKGCTISNSGLSITQPAAALNSSAGATSNVSCYGGNNGSINLNVSGGTSPYSYQWNSGATTQNLSGISSGNYTATITDSKGCSAITSAITITQPAASLNSTVSGAVDVLCYGGTNGTITLNVTGGTTPYTFNWSNGTSVQNLSGITAGLYTVSITDTKGCTKSISGIVIDQPAAALATSLSHITNVSCYGDASGDIDLSVTGGTTPYTYDWSNGVNTQDLNNVTAGTYTVTVTDAHGCSIAENSIVISQPAGPLNGNATTTSNVNCTSGANGSISLTVNGGTLPYLYAWSNGTTTQNNSGLYAGTYVVTITDSKGCSHNTSATVSQPVGSLNTTINTSQNVSCFGGNNGSVTINVTGGTTPYTYQWSNGITTQNINGLPSGSYTVSITDNNGCINIAAAVVNQPSAALSNTISALSNVSCFGEHTGTIDLTANGGTAPYTYSWSNGSTDEDQAALVAGNYTVTVTDANGCTTSNAALSITQPAAGLNSAISSSNNVSCFGGSNGAIDLTVAGGTSPYTYNWSNGANSQDISGIGAGNYTVTITDANGCTISKSAITISQPPAALNGNVNSSNNVSCYGESTGSITLNISGGTVAYNYNWSNGATTQNISNLYSGIYSVTVTDANGCSKSLTGITISQPPAALAASTNGVTAVSCYGGNTGSINLNSSGGTSPYFYQWSNGASTQNILGISSGTYTVTVTDQQGCTTIVSGIAITQPGAALNSTIASQNNVSCNGGNNGGINLNVNGGTAPYSYNWSNGATSQNLGAVAAGNYSVTITDSKGCTSAISGIAVTQPAAALNGNVTSSSNVSCFGGNNGAANLNTTGGTSPYSYQWSNGASTQNISNVNSGTYTVTVTDSKGCTKVVAGILITQPGAALNSNASSTTNVNCFGGNNGSINLAVNGGTTPYSYQWNNGATTQNISNLASGTYTATVTDAQGCTTVVAGVAISQPGAALNANTSATGNVSCFGGGNGNINLAVNGGSSPYAYQWSNGSTSQNISNLSSGNYSVTITDSKGCTTLVNAIAINQPAAPVAANPSSISNVNCFGGSNGSINLTVNGGTAPYTYQWSNSATSQNIVSVISGTYTVTVTDSHGCTDVVAGIAINQPAAALNGLVSSQSDVKCFGGNTGIVNLNVNGGTTPYNYLWSNGTTSQNMSNVLTGTYSVTVTDAEGCTTQIAGIHVNQPGASLNANPSSISNVSCYGGNNGNIDLAVNGGTLPYYYQWNTGSTSQNISNLSSGTYTATITDANGCATIVAGIAVNQPGASVNVSPSVTNNVSCFNGNNGAINLTVNGGTAPYSYLWNNGSTAQNLSNLSSGNYTVTVTDVNGCTNQVAAIAIDQPDAAVSANASSTTDVNCYGGNNGDISLNVVGGTFPYSFQWNNGATTQNLNNLTSGTYTVTVTDANGCAVSVPGIVINQPASSLTSNPTSTTNVNCYGGNNGNINLTVNGGTTPYSYQWNNGATTQNLNNIASGTYTATVTDSKGCTAIASGIVINQPAAPLAASPLSSANVNCFGGNSGSINLSVNGGTVPYSYQWNNGASTQNLNNLTAGAYTATVTDANGCTVQVAAITISEPPSALSGNVVTTQNVNCNSGGNGSVALTASGGTAPYTYLWGTGATTQNLGGLYSGTYVVTVTDSKGCTVSANGIVSQPVGALSSSINVSQNVNCFGGNNGSVILGVSGGTLPYTYGWSNGASTQNLNNVISGAYTVTITDANGCINVTSTIVEQPAAALSASPASTTNVSCFGGNNGNIILSINGGTAPYSYQWNNGSTTQNLSNLSLGTYTVTVTDAQGCTAEVSGIAIGQPGGALSANPSSTSNVSCYGGNNGNINLTVIGGTAPYSYQWNNGVTTQNLINLASGTYSVTVTDAKGCTSQISGIAINQPGIALSANPPSTSNVNCFGGSNGSINLTANGGTAPYLYQWNNGATTQNLANLSSGTYTVTVTDAQGCTTSVSGITINQPGASVTANPSSTNNVSCFGGNNGSISLSVNGGTTPYSYLWSNGASTQNISNLFFGTYTVTVTDAQGCTTQISGIAINQPGASVNANPSSTTNVSCFGGNNGNINLTVNGGTLPYSYQWNNGATTQNLTGLSSGNYTVTVTDIQGCSTQVSGIAINQPGASVTANPSSTTNVSCFGENNGDISLTVNGGTTPYSYQWNNGATTQNLSSLSSGTYTVTVTDVNGCTTEVAGIAINQPGASVTATPSSTTNVSCFGGSNGNINLTVNGGTTPYSYQWNNAATTQNLSGLSSGSYTVTVTDANGCTTQVSGIAINQPGASVTAAPLSTTNVSCFGGNNGNISLSVNGGTLPYAYQWNNGATTQNLNGLSSGSYTVTVTDINGCTTQVAGIVINQPGASVTANPSSTTNVSCYGGNNGNINLTVNGGTTPYSYQWNNGATTQNQGNLISGTYTVTVTDINGCSTQVAGIAINQPGASVTAAPSSTTNVSCYGGNNGNISLTVNGGTLPYSYQWNNGATTQNLTGLASGSYTATITDANGCTTQVAGIAINQPGASVTAAPSTTTNVSCYGGNNGNINLNVNGGTLPYSYQWSNGSTTQNLISLPSGTYTATVTDANGCTTQVAGIAINQPGAAVNAAPSSTANVSCYGGNNGNINLTVNGGTTPYSYQWNNGTTTQNLSNLSSGTYTATITDVNGCSTQVAGIAINQPGAAVNASPTSTTNVSCYGGNNGNIDLTVNGGTLPYSYQWNNGATTQNLNNLLSGTYTVTVTDVNGCTTQIAGIAINQPGASVSAAPSSSNNVNCFGGNNGNINLSVNGGTTPYSYQWSNGETTQNLSNLVAGTYTATVTDANGCTTQVAGIAINQPGAALNGNVSTTQNVSCNSGGNGSITLSANGGTAPYTYLWSNGASTQNISGLYSGTYVVTVTDVMGCTFSAIGIVSQPTGALASSINVAQNINCYGGNNGAVNLSVSGGTSPYSYSWSNGATSQNLNNLPAGNYSVSITDVNGCLNVAYANVQQPAGALNGSPASTTNVNCYSGNNGSIDLNVNGGTVPYSYQWSNGETTQNIANLSSGTYTATVTDVNGCSTQIAGIAINQPGASVSAVPSSTTNVSCYAGNNGNINLNVNGGTTPYSYQWSNGATTQNLNNLASGTYTVTVTDVNGCTTQVASIAINQPGASVSAAPTSTTNVSCYGGNNGTIDLTATGGTAPYSYQWNTGATTQNLSNLSSGTYTATVMDANGCTTQVAGIAINQPGASVSAAPTSTNNVSCYGGNNGNIDLTVNGGTTPYSYQWSNGESTQNIANLSSGTYTVTVTDVNGCTTQVAGIAINQPGASLLASPTSTTNVNCYGGNNGDITLNVTGGTTPYSYQWNNGASTQNLNNLAAGTYTVTVTDVNGCTTQIAGIAINQPGASVTASPTSTTNVNCFGGNNGTITLNANGGTLPYGYQWSSGETTQDITNLPAGTYTVTVTDANGCTTQVAGIAINQPGATVTASPTATNNVNCFGGNNGSIDLTVNGGTLPYSYQWSNGETIQNISNLPAGTYTVTVTDVNGCTTQVAGIAINQPGASLSASPTSTTNVNCFGGNNGDITLTVNGGTLPYSYQWSNGETTQNLSNLPAGTYSVTVTDINGCTTQVAGTAINQPGASVAASPSSTTNVNCFGGNNGDITLNVNGGTTPYSYQWSNGATTQNLNNLPAGSYTVTVTDANGCTTEVTGIAINQPGASVTASPSSTNNVSCFGGSNGTIDLTVNGGTLPYTYQWSNGASTQNLSNLPAGTYTATVTDANGCTTVVSGIAINQPAAAVNANPDSINNINCFGGNNGDISISVNGGTAPYSYQWSNGATVEDINTLNAGNYTVTITDANGCTAQISGIVVAQPNLLTATATFQSNIDCFGGKDGEIDLTVTGGTSPYTYFWSNGATTQNNTYLPAGTYTATVTDAHGCTTIASNIVVLQPIAPLATVVSATQNIICYGSAVGLIDITTTDGSAPYTYLWSNGMTTEDINGLPGGTYTVTVTDSHGCTNVVTTVITQPAAGLSVNGTTNNSNCLYGITGSVNVNTNGGTSPYTYLWSTGGATQSLANAGAGTYTVTVTDANGCSTQGSYIVIDNSAFNANAWGSTEFCIGDSVMLVADSVPAANYQWFMNGQIISGAISTSYIANVVGSYTVTVTNSCGNFNSQPIYVDVHNADSILVSPDQYVCPGESAQLYVSGGATYEWLPVAGLSSSNVSDPFVSPLENTTYTVTVINQYGCKTIDSVNVEIHCDTLIIPSGYSPNDDGLNDNFVIVGIDKYPGNKIWIYNRWGSLVYETHDYDNKWGGISNAKGVYIGKKVPASTYFYVLDLNDGSKPRQGFIVIRY